MLYTFDSLWLHVGQSSKNSTFLKGCPMIFKEPAAALSSPVTYSIDRQRDKNTETWKFFIHVIILAAKYLFSDWLYFSPRRFEAATTFFVERASFRRLHTRVRFFSLRSSKQRVLIIHPYERTNVRSSQSVNPKSGFEFGLRALRYFFSWAVKEPSKVLDFAPFEDILTMTHNYF